LQPQIPPSPAVPTSSPIQPPKDVDLAILLQQYIHWQKYQCPTWAHQLSRVYNILSSNCYDLITIQTWQKKTDWQALDIEPGLGDLLRRNVKKFLYKHAEEQAALEYKEQFKSTKTREEIEIVELEEEGEGLAALYKVAGV
jgi:hypothetical protein